GRGCPTWMATSLARIERPPSAGGPAMAFIAPPRARGPAVPARRRDKQGETVRRSAPPGQGEVRMASMRDKVAELLRRRAEALRMGGEERLRRQRERGKLDARARLDLLFDAGSFREIGLLATHLGRLPGDPGADPAKPAPADGVICGTGLVDGRPLCAASYDFTVHGGSIGPVGERKVTRLRELALRERIPMVWLVDSAGARLSADADQAQWISSFADTG